jgi:hypothetical protein
MKKLNTLKWRKIYVAYGLIILSIAMLFFAERFNGRFMGWMQYVGLSNMIVGLSLQKFVLFMLDINLLAVVLTPISNEDERVEKIRNTIKSNMFNLTIMTIAMLGLLVSPEINTLILAAIILIFYLLMFYLYLYLDPKILYMNREQLLEYHSKKKMKRANIYFGILMGISIGIIMPLIMKYHSWNLYWEICIACGALLGLIKTIYHTQEK